MDAYIAQVIDSFRGSTVDGASPHWLTRFPMWALTVPPAEGEVCYAVYEQTVDSPEDAVVATSLGLYLWRPVGWEFISHRDIGQVVVLGEETSTPMLLLRLRTGAQRREEAASFRDFLDAICCGATRQQGRSRGDVLRAR